MPTVRPPQVVPPRETEGPHLTIPEATLRPDQTFECDNSRVSHPFPKTKMRPTFGFAEGTPTSPWTQQSPREPRPSVPSKTGSCPLECQCASPRRLSTTTPTIERAPAASQHVHRACGTRQNPNPNPVIQGHVRAQSTLLPKARSTATSRCFLRGTC